VARASGQPPLIVTLVTLIIWLILRKLKVEIRNLFVSFYFFSDYLIIIKSGLPCSVDDPVYGSCWLLHQLL